MRVNSVEAFHVINVGLEVCVCSELTKSLKTGRPTQKKAFLENVTQKSCFLSKLWPVNEADSRRFIQRRWWGGFYGTGWMHRNMSIIRDVLEVKSERGLRWSGTVNPRVEKYLLEEENQREDECREDSQHRDNNSHSHKANKQLLWLQEASMFHNQTGEDLSFWIKWLFLCAVGFQAVPIILKESFNNTKREQLLWAVSNPYYIYSEMKPSPPTPWFKLAKAYDSI